MSTAPSRSHVTCTHINRDGHNLPGARLLVLNQAEYRPTHSNLIVAGSFDEVSFLGSPGCTHAGFPKRSSESEFARRHDCELACRARSRLFSSMVCRESGSPKSSPYPTRYQSLASMRELPKPDRPAPGAVRVAPECSCHRCHHGRSRQTS